LTNDAADPLAGSIATDRAITRAIIVRTKCIAALFLLPTDIVCAGTTVKLREWLAERVSVNPHWCTKLFFIPARENLRSRLPAIGSSRAPQASAPSSVDLNAAAG
jgi:hypothetical protein